jgi:hypothetical protein
MALIGVVPGGARASTTEGASRGRAATATANSADRMIIWADCEELLKLRDTELDRWQRRGAGGFACAVRLPGMGGNQRFTGDAARVNDKGFELQRALRESRVVQKARSRGMRLYLGFYLSNSENAATPLADWFDDEQWSHVVLPAVGDLAAAAKLLGFHGLAFDQELYSQLADRRQTATWDWAYPGNTHSEADVRRAARQRGEELMRAMLAQFPSVDILAYATHFPETWDALVQQEVNGDDHAYDHSVQINFWDGLTAVDGYSAVRFVSAVFYKTTHLAGASWDTAFTYQYNRLFALLSRRLSNWSYAADRIFESPFVWIDAGTTGFEAARSPSYVAEQLDAARRWGMGGEFANFAFNPLDKFDYRPYVSGMRSATRPGVVDSHAPDLTIAKPAPPSTDAGADGTVKLSGSATDNLAVRVVRWRTDEGKAGTARMTWTVSAGDPQVGWSWRIDWVADRVPVHLGTTTITMEAEDIKGLTTRRTVSVAR